MDLKLGKKRLNLSSDDPLILAGWQAIFAHQLAGHQVLSSTRSSNSNSKRKGWLPVKSGIAFKYTDIYIEAEVSVPSLSTYTGPQSFQYSFEGTNQQQCRLTLPDQTEIFYSSFDNTPAHVHISISESSLTAGRLEDITAIALAPLLRRSAYYLAHGFSLAMATDASRPPSGLLIAGPSGAGKTTAGLSLIRQGAAFLGNDIALLAPSSEGIDLLASFGLINVSAKTIKEVDALPRRPDHKKMLEPLDLPAESGRGKKPYRYVGDHPLNQPLMRVPLKGVFLLDPDPEWTHLPLNTVIRPLPAAIALARLLEENVDHWDCAQLEQQLNFWTDLTQRVPAFAVTLGREVARYPTTFQEVAQTL